MPRDLGSLSMDELITVLGQKEAVIRSHELRMRELEESVVLLSSALDETKKPVLKEATRGQNQ